MGVCGSKNHLDTVDDSVHVMIQHDKKLAKQKGEPVRGYVPRAEHPLLKPKSEVTTAEEPEDEQPTQ
jgi:hypothetical protein